LRQSSGRLTPQEAASEKVAYHGLVPVRIRAGSTKVFEVFWS